MEASASEAECSGRSILIVDDDVEARALLGKFLRMNGFVVFEAADSDQALTLLNSQLDIDSIITDVQMPSSMDGMALARWIRKTRPALRVMVLSGLDVSEQLAGDDVACFRKPLVPEALLDTLKSATGDTP